MPSPSLTLLRTQSDDRLVALAREGHERAFEAIVERYRRPLLRAARRVLPEGRAEDALQQGLLQAWTALRRGDEVRELRPWLYRIVHHASLNALRVSGYDYDELHDALRIADAGADELERRAVVRQTLASLAALPERQREALLRTAMSGDSQEEVARDLGMSGNALRQLVHRARVNLRAGATALTPLPLVTAAAAGAPRGGSLVERVAELAAGAAGGGASVTLAKAGTAAVLAGSAISGPAIVDRVAERPPRTAEAAATATPTAEAARERATTEPPVPTRAIATPAPGPVRAVAPVRTRRRRAVAEERGTRRSGRDEGDRAEREGERVVAPPEAQEDRRGRDHEDEPDPEKPDNSGPGGPDDADEREEPEELEPPDDPSDSSGPGSGGADEPEHDSSGPGSGGEQLPLASPEPDAEAVPDPH